MPMAAFHFAAAIIGGAFAASSTCTVDDGFAPTVVRDEDVDLAGAVSLLQIWISDPSQQQLERSAWQHSGGDQPQLAAMPGLPNDPLPWVPYSAAPPQAFSASQTYDAQNQLQQVTLPQLQAHASTQPQAVQSAPWMMGLKPVEPASFLRSSLEEERALALAQSSLAQVGIMQGRLSQTAEQLGEAARSLQASRSQQQASAEKASREARSSQTEQLAQALLVEADQLQQQSNTLNEHLAYVATLKNGQAHGADSAPAPEHAKGRAARSEEVATRTQASWAQGKQHLQAFGHFSEESAANAHTDAHRAAVAEAREHRAEALLRKARTRERAAEQHELQIESQAGQEISNLRGMLQQAQMQLQESKAELQRTQAAALQAGEAADLMQEEASRAAAAQAAEVRAQVAEEVQSAKSSVAEAGQLMQGLVNSSVPAVVP